MTVTNIARDEWAEFCERFSGQHAGGLVTVVSQWPDGREQVVAHLLRLISLRANVEPPASDITLTLSNARGEHQTHVMRGVRKLAFVQDPGGGHLGLDVLGDDQITTVRFRV